MNLRISIQWRSQPDNLVVLCKFFCVYRPYKESISKEMNNDNDLNLHSMTKLSGWLRYCLYFRAVTNKAESLRPDSTPAKFFARTCLCEIQMVAHE